MSHAPCTAGFTGTASSSTVMSAFDCAASSFSVEAKPPRVGSRKQRVCGAATSTSAIRWFSGAASLCRSAEKFNPSRQLIMVMPWSPSVPVTNTLSPGRHCAPPSSMPAGNAPTPLVLMNTPSPWPRFTTFVSPVTSATPASRATSAIEAQMRRRSSMGKPSSKMNPQLRYSGRAPLVATSFTVPHTAKRPMSPPGKKWGVTTKLSVENAKRSPGAGAGSTAASSPRSNSSPA